MLNPPVLNNRPISAVNNGSSCLVNPHRPSMYLPSQQHLDAYSAHTSTRQKYNVFNKKNATASGSGGTIGSNSPTNGRKKSIYLADRKLGRTQVKDFLTSKAAVKLQALIRGYVVRSTLPRQRGAVRIQAVARGRFVRRNLAAIRVQAAVRGWIRRLEYRILSLEKRLRDVRQGQRRDLRSVKKKLLHDKEALREEYAARGKELRLEEDRVERAHEIIKNLQSSNKKLRKSTDSLERDCEKLALQNELLKRKYLVLGEEIKKATETVRELSEVNEKWRTAERQYREQKERFLEAIELRVDYFESERSISETCQESTREIVHMVENECTDDPQLVRLVLGMTKDYV